MRVIYFLVVVLILPACTVLFPISATDPKTGIEYVVPPRLQGFPGVGVLAETCVNKAGRVIHRSVEVDGYFEGDIYDCGKMCWYGFMFSNYQYQEFNKVKDRPQHFLKEPGLWRISKENIEDPRCNARATRYGKELAEQNGWPMDFCLAFEKISEVKSRYQDKTEFQRTDIDTPNGPQLGIQKRYVWDRQESEIIGEDVSITLFGAHGTRYAGSALGCRSLGIKGHGRTSSNDVIKDTLKAK